LTIARLLLALHLSCAFGGTAAFWVAASSFKGGPVHRAAGDWFSRFMYAAAATGGVLAFRADRLTTWLVLYVLLVIVTPTQHALAVIRAGPVPARLRSRWHAALNLASMVGSAALLAVVVAWEHWIALPVVPAGFIIGLRNLGYAARRSARPDEWEREHLTSTLTAGIAVHTALLVFGTNRSLDLELTGAVALLPWIGPAAIGLPVIAWLRSRRTSRIFLEEVDKT
jgi:hypothetical protein